MAMGCNYVSSDYDCEYNVTRTAVKAAGFDTAEAIYATNMNGDYDDVFNHNLEWTVVSALCLCVCVSEK